MAEADVADVALWQMRRIGHGQPLLPGGHTPRRVFSIAPRHYMISLLK